MTSNKITPRQIVEEAPYLTRKPFMTPTPPILTDAASWRLIAAEPINQMARSFIQRSVASLNWNITPISPEYEEAARYYTDVYKNFRDLTTRAIKSVCELPQGGAWEIGHFYPAAYGEGEKGTLSFVEFIDAGTLHPTTSAEFPIVQIDPLSSTRQVLFRKDEIVRILIAPYDEYDRLWWQKSPTQDSYLAISALSRIYLYNLKQLEDTPMIGILDLMDFSEEDVVKWAQSFREMIIGIDPVKIPLLYSHEKEAKFIPMTRSPADLSVPQQFQRFAEIVLANYGLSSGDLRLFDTGQSKASAAVNRAISLEGIQFYAELFKDCVQSTLPPFLIFTFDEMDVNAQRTRAQIRATDARTIQTLSWLPIKDRVRQAKEWGVLTISVDPDEVEKEVAKNPALQGNNKFSAPRPGQIETGEGPTRDVLEDDARANAASNPTDFGNKANLWDRATDMIEKAVSRFKQEQPTSQQGRKRDQAQADLIKLLSQTLISHKESVTRSYVSAILGALKDAYPNVQKATLDPALERFISKQDEEPPEPDEEGVGVYRDLQDFLQDLMDADPTRPGYQLEDNERFILALAAILALVYAEGLLGAAETVQADQFIRGLVADPYLTELFEVRDVATLAALQEQAIEIAANIDEGTEYYLRQLLVRGFLRSDSVEDIVTTVQESLFDPGGVIGKRRIQTIVQFELHKAEQQGFLAQMEALGLAHKFWITMLDELVCPLCGVNGEMGIVPIKHLYFGVFGDVLAPPSHPECRCKLGFDEAELERLMTPSYWTGE